MFQKRVDQVIEKMKADRLKKQKSKEYTIEDIERMSIERSRKERIKQINKRNFNPYFY